MRTAPTLTKSQVQQFERDGFVAVKGAFARADADAMQDAWWKELFDLYGIRRDDRATWSQPARDLRGGKASPMQAKINTPRLASAIDDLMGEGRWQWPKHWGRAIATFPHGGTWDVPGTGDAFQAGQWHWDSPVAWHRDAPNGLFAFAFVGEVAPGGGGTSIIAGSHRLLRLWDDELSRCRDAGAQRDAFNRAHPWLAALSGHGAVADRRTLFMEDGAVIAGVSVRVVELTGEPGDMVLCHPTIVHSASRNCGTWPRMMRIGTVPTAALKERLRGK